MSGADIQQLQQLAQQSQGLQPNMGMMRQQLPQVQAPQMQQMQPQFDLSQAIMGMQRQPMQSVQNPFFGGAIPMDFGLPQASQIPADFQVRQFTPAKFNQQPTNDRNYYDNSADFAQQGFNNFGYDVGNTWNGGNQN